MSARTGLEQDNRDRTASQDSQSRIVMAEQLGHVNLDRLA
jgi:hypothetical protein